MSGTAEPEGTAALVFWMLAALGGEADTAQIRDGMALAGDVITSGTVRYHLRALCAARLVCMAERRKRALGPSLWRLTPEGRAVVAAADGSGCVPCGLGWPS